MGEVFQNMSEEEEEEEGSVMDGVMEVTKWAQEKEDIIIIIVTKCVTQHPYIYK